MQRSRRFLTGKVAGEEARPSGQPLE
jgi:hypothetical protein